MRNKKDLESTLTNVRKELEDAGNKWQENEKEILELRKQIAANITSDTATDPELLKKFTACSTTIRRRYQQNIKDLEVKVRGIEESIVNYDSLAQDEEKLSKKREVAHTKVAEHEDRKKEAIRKAKADVLPQELIAENPADAEFIDLGSTPTRIGELYNILAKGEPLVRVEAVNVDGQTVPSSHTEQLPGIYIEFGGPAGLTEAVQKEYQAAQEKALAQAAEQAAAPESKEVKGTPSERLSALIREPAEKVMKEVGGWSEEDLKSLTAEAAVDVIKILPTLFERLGKSLPGVITGETDKASIAKVRELIEASIEKAGASKALGNDQRQILAALKALGA